MMPVAAICPSQRPRIADTAVQCVASSGARIIAVALVTEAIWSQSIWRSWPF